MVLGGDRGWGGDDLVVEHGVIDQERGMVRHGEIRRTGSTIGWEMRTKLNLEMHVES